MRAKFGAIKGVTYILQYSPHSGLASATLCIPPQAMMEPTPAFQNVFGFKISIKNRLWLINLVFLKKVLG